MSMGSVGWIQKSSYSYRLYTNKMEEKKIIGYILT